MKLDNLAQLFNSLGSVTDRGITFLNGSKDENVVSYEALLKSAKLRLGELQAFGIRPGSELIFQLNSEQEFIVTFWACTLGKIIPVPITVGGNQEQRMKLYNVWNTLNHPFIAADQDLTPSLEKFALKNGLEEIHSQMHDRIFVIQDKFNGQGPPRNEGLEATINPDDIAFIQFSSGSTGQTKGVVITHRNVMKNIEAINIANGVSSADRSLSWLPLTHDMGLIAFHLTSTFMGLQQFIMPTSLFIRHPTLWLTKTAEHRATQLYAPNFAYKYLLDSYNPLTFEATDLSSVRFIMNGAEPISPSLCLHFLEEMSPYGLASNTMLTAYGLAEATVGVSFGEVGDLKTYVLDRRYLETGKPFIETELHDEHAVSFVEVGKPIQYCEVRICDDQDQPVSDLILGSIQIKGLSVTKGYYNNPVATEGTITSDGWLRTGDIGFMNNGALVITGRSKDIIFINGQNIYPHDIERVTEELESFELGKVTVCGVSNTRTGSESVVMFILYKKDVHSFIPMVLEAKAHIQQRMGIELQSVLPIKQIPKTTSGKFQRYRLRERYEAGEFSITEQSIRSMINQVKESKKVQSARDQLEQNLIEIVESVTGLINVGITDNLAEAGFDSLKVTQIHQAIDEAYPDRLPISSLYSYTSIHEWASIIRKDAVELETFSIDGSFFHEDDGYEMMAHRFTLPVALVKDIRAIAFAEGYSIHVLASAMFAYLLHTLSEQSAIDVHISIGETRRVTAVRFNFQQHHTLTDLFRNVYEQTEAENSQRSFSIEHMDQMKFKRKEKEIIPLYGEQQLFKISDDILNYYDLIMLVAEDGDVLQYECRFNGRKLKQTRVKRLITNYVKGLQLLVQPELK
ncbi:non-ribosomal peptide synthetase [Paenibacillus polysaccharolyticus]|uniref:non-ribosomal peptide synthetase n=1 Tax=Paenibacillus polysaccharolyticus TaxID=582692 RepID=UPI00203F4455|nr:non-ribosomal peptide synthetase [Paenibacillus polysaccharolyticus]MCM3133480.1 non-ribosomal peptide synthetase [Paenibacillus polysaccharolyticus]